MYNEGEATHFSQVLTDCNIRKCWDQVLEQSDMLNRQKQINIFNRYDSFSINREKVDF